MIPSERQQEDHRWMVRALALAEKGLYTASPNPRVGCVVVGKNGEIVGEGWHERAGEAHAEVMALAQAGGRARGATVYVTLEPCCHHGRTPPCVEALIRAGVLRVVVGLRDPNPLVQGRGFAGLRAAGIYVEEGVMAQASRALNEGFFSRMRRGVPWVRIKLAMSLDGYMALPNGVSQWITGEMARADGHAWRARSCAVLTGIGTVRVDDPELSVRYVQTARQPTRIVVDPRLRISPRARVLRGGALIACLSQEMAWCCEQLSGQASGDGALDSDADVWRGGVSREEHCAEWEARFQVLEQMGCEILCVPVSEGREQGRAPGVDLPILMQLLAQRGVNELHVEAGPRLNGALIAANCVDECLLYTAPILLGRGLGLWDLPAPSDLCAVTRWVWHRVDRIGDDLRLVLRVRGDRAGGLQVGGVEEKG